MTDKFDSTPSNSPELTGPDEPTSPTYRLFEPWDDDRSEIPATDADTTALIDRAVQDLVIIRAPFELDTLPIISVLVSLAAEVESRLPDAVADARDHGYSWDAIATRLNTATAATSRRYASYARRRTTADQA